MPANSNWARWIFASVAKTLKEVATDASIPVLVEHLDERSETFMRASDRVEIRITGPFTQEQSQGYFRIYVDVNVLLSSRYDGSKKNQYTILKYAGLFHEAMDMPIPVWNYGNEPGDFVDDDPDTQVFLGCLSPRPGNSESVRVFNFGQIDKTDKLKQSAVDARYVMYLSE
jgi:hypothetical protein